MHAVFALCNELTYFYCAFNKRDETHIESVAVNLLFVLENAILRVCMKIEGDKLKATRYIESLDTVRFNPNDNKTAYIHAEIEVLISLLFGEKVAVSEPVSFDSRNFAKVLTRVLNGRKPEHIESVLYANPFQVALFEEHIKKSNNKVIGNPFAKMVSERISNPDFILSSISALNLPAETEANKNLRKQIRKSRVEIGKFFKAGQVDKALKEIGEFDETQAAYLCEVCSYFSNEEITEKKRQIIAKKNPNLLTEYINKIYSVERSSLKEMRSSAYPNNIDHYPAEFEEKMIEIKNGYNEIIKVIKKDSVTADIKDRSIIYKYRDIIHPDIFEGVLEFVDDCYNRLIANVICADTGQFSTRGNPKNPYVMTADLFCRQFPRLENDSISVEESETALIMPEANEILTSKQIDDIGDELINWQAIWSVLADSKWQESVLNLRISVDGKTEDYNKNLRREALVKHKELLEKKLNGEDWLASGAKTKSSKYTQDIKKNVTGDVGGVLAGLAGFSIAKYLLADMELSFTLGAITFGMNTLVKHTISKRKPKSTKDGIIQGIKKVR